MMLRATVVDVDPRDPTRVWVTIPQKYGTKPVRVFTRVQVTKGDHVYVTNTSVTRVPQWVVFDQQTEVGTWGNPYPHTHPIGQVDGLVDWVKEYEAWAKDHAARLDAADKRIAEGKAEVDAARKDLTQAQTDIAEAVRKATLEQARLDQAEANLDQMGRNLTAAGGRISANETALAGAQKRLESAETTVQKTSADLGVLEGTVGDVSAKAEASELKALEALNRAGTAQAAADGKTTITRAVEPRTTQPGTAVGDTHFTMSSMGGGGQVLRQQRWDGSTWQDEALSHQVISSVDLGKATVGELDGGRIKAGSILSDRVVVSQGENLIPDPTFLSAAMTISRTTGTAWRIGTAANGSKVLTTNSTTQSDVPLTGAPDGWMQVDSTAKYQLQMLAAGPDQLSAYLMLLFVDGTTKADGFQWVRPLTGTLTPKIVEWDLAALGGPVAVRPMIRRNPTPSGASNYWQQIGAVTFRRKVNTVLIEDGAVTGEKIEASTVSGALGQFLKVESQTGVFTDSLTGRNARLLGETVAESINITGMLRGRDAILDGTLDVAQLNVTGEMSAKIISTATLQARQGFFTDGLTAQDAALLGTTVAEKLVVTDAFSARVVNAMTAQTKQLVVTEDAILNKATVIQSLVTPELISQKADIGDLAARMVTSGKLQTSTAANRGVKIDNSGVRAWDDTGRQTVNLNGKNNYLTGTFATAEKEQRVEIKSGGSVAAADFYGSGNTVDHLGVWHQADAGDSTASRIISQNGMTRTAGNPGLVMWPFRGDFALMGRWARNSDTVKMFWTVNYNGIPGGAWADLVYTYTTPFPTQYTDLVPILSVESRSGAECIAVVKTSTPEKITFRVVNKSTNATDVFYLRGVTYNFNTVEYKNSNW